MSAAAAQEAAARAQIEYYFSYANYSRDEYLRSLADADGYVALDALQDFPKLHKLTQGDGALLKRAAASSTRLELSEDDKVRARRIGASSTGRQAQHLVLDANALVRGRGAALQAYADNFWTTTEVLAEVKDAESRARLAALPFRLETRRPSPQAVDRVSQFARKTGDLASLSPVDVQVLALAYDLEVEAAGSDDHLRREPEGVAAPCAKKEPAAPRQPAPRPKPRPAAARTAPPPVSWAAAVTAPPPPVAEAPVEEPEAAPEPAPVPPPAVEEPPAPLPPPPPEVDEATTADSAAAPPSRILAGNAIGAMDAADDDGVGWLDADDVQAAVATGELAFDGRRCADDAMPPCACACATADYAMQNVLLQLGLRLVGVDGLVIARTKRWVLRCGACFHLEDDASKLFCSRCGSTPLRRVAVGVDASGARRVYLNKNKAPNARGSKFGLPKPGKAGRYEGELLLREDQLHTGIWRQKAARARSAKAARSVFGPEVTESLEALQLVQRANLTVGVGRKNPNAMSNGRERRGKPRKKR